MLLFFDTETTGLPKNFNAPAGDVKNWPRLVQIAWILADWDGNIFDKKEYIIKPEGFQIPAKSAMVHGVTQEIAEQNGYDLEMVLQQFNTRVYKSEALVCHNVSFDMKIVGAEYVRTNLTMPKRETICTKEESTSYCKLPAKFGNGYKWPKLQELHLHLFGEEFANAHNALVDVKATMNCFFELYKIGVIK